MEVAAEYDDKLMEKYFEDPNSLGVEEVQAALRQAVIDMKIVLMMCGSAFKNKGVQAMLDAVCTYLPSPADIEAVEGINPKTDAKELRKPNNSEPFAALAFKIVNDPFVGRLTYMRVYSGRLENGTYVINTRSDKKERISRLYQMHAN